MLSSQMDGVKAVTVWCGAGRFANLRRGGKSLPKMSVHLDTSILNRMTAQGLKTMKLKSASKVSSGYSFPASSLRPSIHPPIALWCSSTPTVEPPPLTLANGSSCSLHTFLHFLLLLECPGSPNKLTWGVWCLVSSCGVRVRDDLVSSWMLWIKSQFTRTLTTFIYLILNSSNSSLLLKKTWKQCCLVAWSVTCRASLTVVDIPYRPPSYESVGWVN